MFRNIKNFYKNLKLSNKVLLTIMIIIFIQLILNLLLFKQINSGQNSIDIVLRTYFSSIFGYFIGNNKKEKVITENMTYNKNKIIIITIFSILSLLVLILVRNFILLSGKDVANISILRDIISGSIGYLISLEKTN